MGTDVQSLTLGGGEFVVLTRSEYERLRNVERAAKDTDLPEWPAADAEGCRPAKEFARVSIARDIINERTALGLTQVELAKLAGIRQETLCRLETGKHSPNVRSVEKIERALKQAAKDRSTGRSKAKDPANKGRK